MASKHPVLTCAEAVEWEQEILGGDAAAEWRAMLRAGEALGFEAEKDFFEIAPLPEEARFLILAGKGNNAGDGFLAAAGLLTRRAEATVMVVFLMGENALGTLARRAWSELVAAGEHRVTFFSLQPERDAVDQLEEHLGNGCFHISFDGIFGMNFRPPFRSPVDRVVEWLNAFGGIAMRAAVDLPSGVSDQAADLALRADFTYFTGSVKEPALETGNARWAGRVRYLDIGFFDRSSPSFSDRKPSVSTRAELAPWTGLRDPFAHKKNFGHLLVVGGSRTMPGAILMSILAAIRSGVGLVTALVPESLTAAFAARVPEAMWLGCPETDGGGLGLDGLMLWRQALPKADAVLVGPGVGVDPETQAFLEEIFRQVNVPAVIDAEGLQLKGAQILMKRDEMRGQIFVTPHAGEYQRISGKSFDETGEAGLREFCDRSGFSVLLKGPPFTRICDLTGRISYVFPGGPVLARGGSGDILAGIAGSLAARHTDDIASAGRAAALWHGLAAERLARTSGQSAVRTTGILDHLSAILREG